MGAPCLTGPYLGPKGRQAQGPALLSQDSPGVFLKQAKDQRRSCDRHILCVVEAWQKATELGGYREVQDEGNGLRCVTVASDGIQG